MLNKKFDPNKPLKLQAQSINNMTAEEEARMPYSLQRARGFKLKRFMFTIKVMPEQISNRELFADVIRTNFGYGCFNIFVFDKFAINKKYSPLWRCIGDRCLPFQKGKCKKWKILRVGWQCSKNRKFRPNWVKVANITIEDTFNEKTAQDYVYRWGERQDRMRKRFRWFWSGK